MSRDSLPPLEDEFSRALLGSADADAPTPAAYAKAAAALGIGVGVGASLPAAAAVAAASAAGVARWSSSLSAKLFFGLSGALLVGGAGAVLMRNSDATGALPQADVARAALVPAGKSPTAIPSLLAPRGARPAAPTVASAEPASPAARIATPGSVLPAQRSSVAAPTARRTPRAAAPVKAAAAPVPDSSLSEQVQSLDRARLALAARDSSSALSEIARYRATWPSGVFLTEASVLEIEALAARGERSTARARAADFVAAHPDSPQADRLRALIPNKKP